MSEIDNTQRAAIEAAAKKFGLLNAQRALQDPQHGIDPQQADAIEDAARRFGLRLPLRAQRRDVEPMSVVNAIFITQNVCVEQC